MPSFPPQDQQIRQTHAQLINLVVNACHVDESKAQLEPALMQAQDAGWDMLVQRIHRILAGQRDEALLNGLDHEDSVIIRSILEGLQNPASLPDPKQQADPTLAAPGLAHMIHAAASGDAQALQHLSFMAEQMVNAPGDLRQLGAIMRPLINGERDPDVLCKGMSSTGEHLVLNILEELNKLALQ